MISLLLPTRHRVEKVTRAIQSVIDTATSRYHYEIIIRVAKDDEETLAALPKLLHMGPVKAVVSYPYQGYRQVTNMIHECQLLARGDWLCMFTDDIIFETKHWDTQIMALPPKTLGMWHVHKLGESTYYDDPGCGCLFFPNNFWREYGYADMSTLDDCGIWQLARRNGWDTAYIDGTFWHQRDKDLIYKERKRDIGPNSLTDRHEQIYDLHHPATKLITGVL